MSTPTLHGNTGGTLSQGYGLVNFLNGTGAQPRGRQIVAQFYSLFSESRNSGQSSSIEHIQAGTSRDEPTWHTDDAILDSKPSILPEMLIVFRNARVLHNRAAF